MFGVNNAFGKIIEMFDRRQVGEKRAEIGADEIREPAERQNRQIDRKGADKSDDLIFRKGAKQQAE